MHGGVAGRSASDLLVVLSTFNGARYLADQIESIRAQTIADWTLLVRDDGSTDGTVDVVRSLACRDGRIQLLPPDGRNLGAGASFGCLLEHALARGARYVALADQDDIWLPEKLERQLDAIREIEAREGEDRPALVHSDLRVVDADLRMVHASYRRYEGLRPAPADMPLRRYLAQNLVTGCATLVNRPLAALAVPFPSVAMHDWWLAQCAAAAGTVRFLPHSTVLYRQHGANVVGARGDVGRIAHVLRRPRAWWAKSFRDFTLGVGQAQELERRVRARYGHDFRTADLLTKYAAAFRASTSPLTRLRRVRQLGVGPAGVRQRLLYLLRVCLYMEISVP